MKGLSKRQQFRRAADPYPFDYTLLSHLYIHEDNDNVIDFSGFSTNQERRNEVQNLLRKRDQEKHTESACKFYEHSAETVFLHLQGSEDYEQDTSPTQQVPTNLEPTFQHPRRQISHLLSIRDSCEYIWLMTQFSESNAPVARMFSSVKSLMGYIKRNGMKLPERAKKRSNEMTTILSISNPLMHMSSKNEQPPRSFDNPRSPTFPLVSNHFDLPSAKWINFQINAHNPDSSMKLKQLLSHFSIHKSVLDKCLFLPKQDYVDMSHLNSSASGYMFFVINCTPVNAKLFPCSDLNSQHDGSVPAVEMEPIYGDGTPELGRDSFQKSLIELRLDAVQRRLPRRCVPDPVPVGVILFADWIITVHDQPFAEMDDLLRVIQIHCSQLDNMRIEATPSSPISRAAGMVAPRPKSFTTAFIYSAFFQICVGHNADSMVFARAVNNLSDAAFETNVLESKRNKLLSYVIAMRLCFAECSAEILRRENVVAEVLRNDGARNFLWLEKDVRAQLMNVQAHLQYLKNEIGECHNTIMVANWYANISYYWILLNNGNRSLRRLLLLAEMVNIFTGVSIVQGLFSMNVRIPFDSNADPPNTSLVPFWVLAVLLLVYLLWCVRAIWDICVRKRFKSVSLF